MIDTVLVGAGGVLGALARAGVGWLIESRTFPWATLAVNVIGSFVLGIVLFSPVPTAVVLFVGVGFCGAFTTFSAFSYHTISLWEDRSAAAAGVHAVGSLLTALGGFALGAFIVTTIGSFP